MVHGRDKMRQMMTPEPTTNSRTVADNRRALAQVRDPFHLLIAELEGYFTSVLAIHRTALEQSWMGHIRAKVAPYPLLIPGHSWSENVKEGYIRYLTSSTRGQIEVKVTLPIPTPGRPVAEITTGGIAHWHLVALLGEKLGLNFFKEEHGGFLVTFANKE